MEIYFSITLLKVTRNRAMSSHPNKLSITVKNLKPSEMLKFCGLLPMNTMLLK
jgi:hypothetical protein